MVGQVHLQGRDRHIAVRGGMKISALGLVLGRAGGANPVHGFTARAHLRNDRLSRMAPTQATQFDVADLLKRQIGNVHVQQPRAVSHQMLLLHLQNQLTRLLCGRRQMHPVAIYLGKSDGRNTK